MTIKKMLTFLAAALLLLLTALGQPQTTQADTQSAQIQKIQKAGVLKVGVKQDVPNFGYYSAETGKY